MSRGKGEGGRSGKFGVGGQGGRGKTPQQRERQNQLTRGLGEVRVRPGGRVGCSEGQGEREGKGWRAVTDDQLSRVGGK